MNKLILIFLALFIFSCSIDRTILEISDNERAILATFQELPSKSILKITDEKEPGEKLILCLTYIDEESRKSLPNQLVKFYHTSTNGNYEQTDPNDESTARLRGKAFTDDKGRIYIETILPGDYGSSSDNRHIHTTVIRTRPKNIDIHFKQYTGYMGNRFIKGSDNHFLADLKKTKEDKLISFLTIKVKKPNQGEK